MRTYSKIACLSLASVLSFGVAMPSYSFASRMTPQQYAQYQAIKEAQKIQDAINQKKNFENQITQYYKMGLQAYTNKNYGDCIKYLTETHVASKFQNQKDYNIALGESYRQYKNFTMALTYQIKAFNMGANDYTTLTGIGFSYMDLQNYKQAYPYLLKASQLYPNRPELLWDLGVTCLKLNNESGVLSAMQKLISIKPNHNPDAYIYMGNIYDNHKRYDEGLAIFKKGLNYYPKEGLLWYRAAHEYFSANNWADGIPYYQKAAELLPQNLDIYYEWGLSYLNLDNTDEAYKICEIMAKIAPKDDRTVDLSDKVNQRIMQKQLEEQMRIDQINQDIQQQMDITNQMTQQAVMESTNM